ncbi:unnamed protein product [Schistosoma rodhaini]|uniref:putative exonuclease n=1 Tax=Schistosoma mansoni TaxID=6183 RepID=UPI0001A632A4|nr:putative exonuclease [Schistosoma mansoni]CAH8452363.1 unnamed protein product [Schistosoma rodhaini]|eukprot:XP_018648123.1 putative exonuclease [Schistosoma mansoni]
MGIKGLLPFLKNASAPINLADFSGYVAAVDVYCWIHRSSYACASDLALGIPTDQYVRYVIKYINLMKSCNVKPILVFDGSDLPSKAETDLKRRETKELNRKKAAEYLMKGDKAAAQECFERSVFVTSEMAYEVLRAARNMGVDCVVAPYEADAQLAYLNRTGYADFVITEDSDLLLFGCRQVVFKLDLSGSGVLVAAASGICECCGIPASQFTESKFRYMGIMAGCDYFSGIPGIGLNTAAKILRQTRITNFRELLLKLGFYTKLSNNALAKDDTEVVNTENTRGKRQNVKTNYNKSSQISESLLHTAVRAERTFRLQVIFDIASRCQKRFSEPTPEDIDEELHNLDELKGSDEDEVDLFSYAGRVLKDNEKAFNRALGNISYSDDTIIDNYYPCTSKNDSMQVNGAIIGHSTIQTKMQSSGLRPNPDRLKISIWDKSYPIQKYVLRVYGQTEEVLDTPKLKDRNHLPSSIVSASGYFPIPEKSNDVPKAIDDAINSPPNDDDLGRSQTSRSPVFYKANSNPFRIASESYLCKSKEKVDNNFDISVMLNDERKDYSSIVFSSNMQSVCRRSLDFKYSQYKKPCQPLWRNSTLIESNNKQSNSSDSLKPDLNKSETELQDSSSSTESSPSFLNSHKVASHTSSLPNGKITCDRLSQISKRSPSVQNPHVPDIALPNASILDLKHNSISKLPSNNLKSKHPSHSKISGKNRLPSVQSSTLDSFFQKWKFK